MKIRGLSAGVTYRRPFFEPSVEDGRREVRHLRFCRSPPGQPNASTPALFCSTPPLSASYISLSTPDSLAQPIRPTPTFHGNLVAPVSSSTFHQLFTSPSIWWTTTPQAAPSLLSAWYFSQRAAREKPAEPTILRTVWIHGLINFKTRTIP